MSEAGRRGLGLMGLALAVVACTQTRPTPAELGVAPGASRLPSTVVQGESLGAGPSSRAPRAGIVAALVRWPAGVQAPVAVRASLAAPADLGGAIASLEAAGQDLANQQAYFPFPALPSGSYRLVVSALGPQGLALGQLEQSVEVPPGDARLVELNLTLPEVAQPTPPRTSPNPRPDLAGASPGPVAGSPAFGRPSPVPSVAASAPVPVPPPPPPPPGPPNFNALVAQALAMDAMGQAMAADAANRLEGLLPADRGVLAEEVATAGTALAQMMLVKAAVVGEQGPALRALGSALRGKSEAEVEALCLMRGAQDLTQQWADACGPAVVQVIQGEVNPVRALALHQEPIHTVSPTKDCRVLATEQKTLLEAYGGVAVPRGLFGGEGVGITPMLNDHAGPVSRVRYEVEAASDTQAFDRLSARLKAGHDVPIRIGFGALGAEDRGHFMVALSTRGPLGSREALIHDPFSGKTAWILEGAMRGADFKPFFAETARWTHMHVPIPPGGAGLAFRLAPF